MICGRRCGDLLDPDTFFRIHEAKRSADSQFYIPRVVQRVSLGGSRVATALGEVAVDFCFGSPVEFDDQRVWPIYVLWADGEVFYVNADLSSDWVVEGPVEVLPEQEENYSQGYHKLEKQKFREKILTTFSLFNLILFNCLKALGA